MSQCSRKNPSWLLNHQSVVTMKRVFALIFGICSVCCSAQVMTPAQYTETFVKALKLASPAAKISVKADLELEVAVNDAGPHRAFLDNAYRAYLQSPKALDEIIRTYSAAILEPRDSKAKIDRARIVPIVKDRGWLGEVAKSLKSRSAAAPAENVYEDLNEELVIVYAEDSPKNIRYLTPKDLDELATAKKELRLLAVSNLKKILPEIKMHDGGAVFMVTAGGDYEASLLLFDSLWSGGAIKVDGDIVVAVPARDLLLVTGSNSPAGIKKLRELAAKFSRESTYPLTDALFVYRGGRFKNLDKKQ
jgi:uncharacterized protein YtpQ (UPF0354 family)